MGVLFDNPLSLPDSGTGSLVASEVRTKSETSYIYDGISTRNEGTSAGNNYEYAVPFRSVEFDVPLRYFP